MDKEDVIALAYNEWIPMNQDVSLRAAFFAGWKAREQAPNTLIIDTTHAQMKPIPNSSAAAPPSVFIVETRPRDEPLPEGARKYIREVPEISTVIHRGVDPR